MNQDYFGGVKTDSVIFIPFYLFSQHMYAALHNFFLLKTFTAHKLHNSNSGKTIHLVFSENETQCSEQSLKLEVLVHSTIKTNQQQLKSTPSWPEAVENVQVFPFVQSLGCSVRMFRPQKYFLCFLWCWLVQFKFQSIVKLIWSSLYGMTSLIIFGNCFRKLMLLAGKCW